MATVTATTTIKDPTVPVTPAMRRKVEKAGADLAAARKQWQKSTAAAAEVALEAHDAGMTEVELAALLGVDRARTVRRWLGKD